MNPNQKSEQFLSVLQAHKGIIYKVANSYCKSFDDREDLVQEIIIQLWRSFDNYDKKYKYSTWMYQIALNVAISFYRKETRRKRKVINGPISESIFFFADEQPVSKDEDINLLQKFIQELKELDKALMLLYLEEKSYKEIAEIIGISQTNVATKISRIKSILKRKFKRVNNG